MKFEELCQIADSVEKLYGLYKSADIASSVEDYAADLLIAIDEKEFDMICRQISLKTGLMIPTKVSMRQAANRTIELVQDANLGLMCGGNPE